MKRLIGIFLILSGLVAYSQPARLSDMNLDHFTVREKRISGEELKLIPEQYLKHPELGIKPFASSPESNYVELINKRDAFSRFYVKENTKGSGFIQQKAYTPINFLDENGYWREINYRLEKKGQKKFEANNQPNPLSINLVGNVVTIKNSDHVIQIKNPELIYRDINGTEVSLGIGNLENFTGGDDGILIRDFYPEIDLVYSVRNDQLETSFILNKKLPFFSGEIILRQQVVLPEKLSFDNVDGIPGHNEIFINDDNNIPFFIIEKGYAFENILTSDPYRIKSKVTQNGILEFPVSLQWLNDPSRVYPVIIDPLVTIQNTLPLASIPGTKFSPVCWTNGCDYFLTVPAPANATITAIKQSFEMHAFGLCFAEDGGWSIDYGACHTPAAAPGVITSPFHIPNFFLTINNNPIPEFIACLPPPQCASYNLDFTLHFYRCNNDPDTNCTANCVRATAPWTMSVEGYTVQLSYLTPYQQTCGSSNVDLICVPEFGIAPYTFSWLPGGAINDTISVSPVTTTTYTVTVTDFCGNTFSDTTTVSTSGNINPGFTITPNPVCENTNVTLNGNGAGPATDYDWIVSGSNAPGGVVDDTQSPVISYNLAGNYDVILSYSNGGCTSNDTVPITVSAQVIPDVTMSAQPSVSICAGDTVTFKAAPVNGGVTPNYEWLIDGLSVQNGNIDSLVTSSLNNGSSVSVIMTSSQACTNPVTDTATLFIAINSSLTPLVTISPDTSVCTASPITLNAVPVHGGATPTYQWYANGNPIAGATNASYTFVVTPPDTIISVEMTSSFSCVSSSTAIDTTIINILSNITPVVNINAAPSGIVCAGDTVQYNAQTVNGGSTPVYQWYLNGVATTVTDSVYSLVPSDNDSISVILTSSLTCVVSPTGSDYMITGVSPSVSPSVTMSAAPSIMVCQNDTIIFTASAVNAGSAPVYSWSVNGNPAGINDSIFSVSNLNNNDQVRVIVTSSLGCAPISSDTDMVTVSVIGSVSASVNIVSSTGAICEGEPVQYIAVPNNGGPAPAFQWLINGVPTGMTNDTIILTTLMSQDTLQAIMTSSLGCVSPANDTSTYISNLLPRVMPQIDIVSTPLDTVCLGQQVVLNANIQNGGTAPLIQWYLNSIFTNVTSTTFTTSFLPGDIVVANMISNANCLIASGDTSNYIRIVYHQPLSIFLTANPPECPGVSDTIVAHPSGGNGGPYDIFWNNTSYNNDSLVIVPGRNTVVSVEVRDNCTVQSYTYNYTVPVLLGPLAEFSYVNPQPGSFQNNVQFINLSLDADTWTWYFPDGQESVDWNPVHTFLVEGVYDVMLVTQNNTGCVDTVIYNVIVKEELAVFYPNSFTPNGDGVNDIFKPMGASLEDYTMTIWDRWGEKIYEGNSLSAWDGRIKDSSNFAPEGVYVFKIDLIGDKFETKEVTGKVTLVR